MIGGTLALAMRGVVLMIALTGCRQVFGLEEPVRRDAHVDMEVDPDAPVDAALGPWSTATEIVELTSGTGDDDPSLTDDRLEIYFGSRRAGSLGGEDIWFATRPTVASPWGTPINASELNSGASETTPKLTGNGLAIFFTRTTTADIYFATRLSRSSSWGTPSRIAELSTSGGDYGASASSDLRHVVLGSGATEPEDALYTSDRASTNVPWGAPVRIAELDVVGVSENDPFEPVPTAIYFRTTSTDRNHHIYVARRASPSVPYGMPVELVGPNVPGTNDTDPWVSADERLLVFSSDRSGVARLYMSTR